MHEHGTPQVHGLQQHSCVAAGTVRHPLDSSPKTNAPPAAAIENFMALYPSCNVSWYGVNPYDYTKPAAP
jgi:hypothetical protein